MLFFPILLFLLSLQLIGAIMIEGGAYSPGLKLYGYPNGTAAVFAAYMISFLVLTFLLSRRRRLRGSVDLGQTQRYRRVEGNRIQARLLMIVLAVAVASLFLFDLMPVLAGRVSRAQYRGTERSFGFILALILDYWLPGLLTYAALTVPRHSVIRGRKALLLTAVISFLFGAATGFKTAGFFTVLPMIVAATWRRQLTLRTVFFLFTGLAFAVVILFFSAMVFDAQIGANQIMEYLVTRATVLTSEVNWLFVEKLKSSQDIEGYHRIFLSIFGRRLAALVTGQTVQEFMATPGSTWASLITSAAGYSPTAIARGFNLTGSVFAEGIALGGTFGLALLTCISIAIFALIFRLIDRMIDQRRFLLASLGVLYFSKVLVPWIYSGGIPRIFNAIVIIGMASTMLILQSFANFSRKKIVFT